jgi:hypothetical protein
LTTTEESLVDEDVQDGELVRESLAGELLAEYEQLAVSLLGEGKGEASCDGDDEVNNAPAVDDVVLEFSPKVSGDEIDESEDDEGGSGSEGASDDRWQAAEANGREAVAAAIDRLRRVAAASTSTETEPARAGHAHASNRLVSARFK